MTKREQKVLENAIERLPDKQADALRMRIWSDVGMDTIAISLGVDWEEAQSLVEEGLTNLENDLVRRRLSVEDYPFLFKKLEMAA